jgi:hypothetical protein
VGEGETDSRLDVIVCVHFAPCSLSQILSKTLSVVEGSAVEGLHALCFYPPKVGYALCCDATFTP